MNHEHLPYAENDNPTIEKQLDLLRVNLARSTYPHYPSFEDRLVFYGNDMPRSADGNILLPDGTWTVNSHPNRRDIEAAPSPEEQSHLLQQGLELDGLGRPLHPWFRHMIQDPTIGVITGKGAYWNWGPNYTVDPIIIKNRHIALVVRADTGALALPGGFIDVGEDALQAGVREANEELGLQLDNNEVDQLRLVYQGPVVDIRVTANAWPETSALLFACKDSHNLPVLRPSEESPQVAWVPIEEILDGNVLHGSHNFLFQQALTHM